MKYLVTAGPTREPIDPVRFIGNRSSGKMGYAIARAALAAGHEVRLISGPVSLPVPDGIPVEFIETAQDMHDAVHRALPWCDVLVMVAAVADWRPAEPASEKIKKHDGEAEIRLERTTDILASVKALKGLRTFVGFAAETGEASTEAARKCRDKGLDMVVANDVSAHDAGFRVDTNRVTLVSPEGELEHLPLMPKARLAELIVDRIDTLATLPEG